MGEQLSSPSTDGLFDAFSDVHRRRVLVNLLDHNPQAVDQLSASPPGASEATTDSPGGSLTGALETTDVDGGAVLLHHGHLPKLADYGLIEWDRDEDEVHKGPNFDDVRPLLVLLEENRETLPDDWL
ncbi:transcriptional regulator [Halorubrum sp. JWXQ-INN 858]|uniref:DUF7344 domain-containing protein n=1 Tax=Halorubrum sp. JWXQ-INN 858 TaxID=2690782 RepID=UPI00135ADAB8|nr:transcriptional regulator [Halorubrum sp. JWXQ-INN 858]MWV64305.1 transcriptional regulator [Halorubrum sp. JWXQ-INN 858]